MMCAKFQISEIDWEEFKKAGLRNFANLWEKARWKQTWHISRDSAEFSERVDIRFLNVRQCTCEF